MPEERAFTRRQPGVNPIALELDRLAEQQALQTLGRGRSPLASPTAATAADTRQAAAYTAVLDRIKTAWGPEGGADVVLGELPDDELASHAQMANADIDRYIASGQAYQTPEGDLYTTDANGPDLRPHLAIIQEQQNREIAPAIPPTSDEPTIGTPELKQSLRRQILNAKNMLYQ